MADYVSSLNGSQMDQALLDMAEHTSEAYAVGERNGVPVDSSDVTYHNNARYYAQQAQSIAPASVTEAVRWDVAQTALTDANRLQARENIEATSHNYNLVDNGWFNVNSRNVNGAVSGGQTGLDRWVVNASASNSVTMATGSITLPSAGYEVIQYLNDMTSTYGKYVTLSVRDNSGNIYSASVVMPTSPSVQNYINSTQSGIRMRLRYTGSYWWVMLDANSAGTDVIIKAVKLELGSFSTLENDTLPDYATELARCIYSTANTADTYANNGFGKTNPNLFDNSFFSVNQRSATTVTLNGTEAYIADRWIAGSFGTYTHNSDNTITITCPNNTSFAGLTQRIDPIYKGGTYTYSIRLSNDTVISLQGTMPSGSGLNVYNITINGVSWQVLFRSDGSVYWITLRCNVANTTETVKAIKLELGSVSTLANDMPPNYATELEKCKYYFERLKVKNGYSVFGNGHAIDTEHAYIFVPITPKRTESYTVTKNGVLQLYSTAGRLVSTIAKDMSAANSLATLYVTSSNLVAGTPYFLRAGQDSTAYIDLSADL